MKKETIQDFTVKITQSNRSQLVVIIYELIQISLEEAEEYVQKGDMEQFKFVLSRAQGLIKELMEALDFNYPISVELLQLYLFVNRKLLQAMIQKRTEPLTGLDKVIGNLKHAFEQVCKQDHSPPLMLNTQKIYAGLTYEKSSLSEICSGDTNRGYQV